MRARQSTHVSEQRAYWLDLFTWKTWQEYLAAGASVSGFREGRRGYVQQLFDPHRQLFPFFRHSVTPRWNPSMIEHPCYYM